MTVLPFKASNEGQWGQKLKFSDVEIKTYFFRIFKTTL